MGGEKMAMITVEWGLQVLEHTKNKKDQRQKQNLTFGRGREKT